MINLSQLAIGFFLALLISLAAFRVRALNRSGALTATLVGTIVFDLGGWEWAFLLIGFFISSSGLSKLFGKKKANLTEKFSKGSRRDAIQVLANGGIATLFVICHAIFPGAAWPWLGYAGALAAANADTWATELGVLSKAQPRLITRWTPVERGTSGGITAEGTLASLGGAFFIAVLAVFFFPGKAVLGWFGPAAGLTFTAIFNQIAWITLAGLIGSLADSYFGATVQAIYFCPQCQKETERNPFHTCGSPTVLKRGIRWMNNDLVNILCTLVGAAVAIL